MRGEQRHVSSLSFSVLIFEFVIAVGRASDAALWSKWHGYRSSSLASASHDQIKQYQQDLTAALLVNQINSPVDAVAYIQQNPHLASPFEILVAHIDLPEKEIARILVAKAQLMDHEASQNNW